jgi:hypothetical protein
MGSTATTTRRHGEVKLISGYSDPRRRANANRGSDHKERVPPMADQNPMGRGVVVSAHGESHSDARPSDG